MLKNAPYFSVSQSLEILLGDYDRFLRRSEPFNLCRIGGPYSGDYEEYYLLRYNVT
jgi:hypothetical protein